ncbi:MAG TPA: HNH endonuclease signature motif containing protein [Phenylobacterium sp.]|jgi:hypothetical protein|nr:HNH endonuclease signature motif containing protein [Phenylobacterium sp.]
MKGHRIPYSADEMAWLEANRTLPISEYAAGFNQTFSRDVAAANLHALRKRKGWKTGRTGKFAKGQEPANKGVPCAPGVGGRHPNAQRTQFKKGHGRSGVALKLYQPIGTERLSKEGYIQRKIHDGLPLQSRWRGVHMIRWEAINGPIPKGQCLKALDGDRTNTDPANWRLVSRSLLPALNGGRHKKRPSYDGAAPELKPTLLVLAEVEDRSRKLRRKEAA